jgi:fused signal recognition particle receptor
MGADAASVAYDALTSATAKKTDLLIVDTAGRLQNKVNLMQELAKIYGVIEKAKIIIIYILLLQLTQRADLMH